MRIALITAKGGSQHINNKNITEIAGQPCLYWPLSAAQEAESIDAVFVSTENPDIMKVAEHYGAKVIERPDELAQPLSNHGDAILHGARAAQEALATDIETVTILLGNTVMTTAGDIDESIRVTLSDPQVDSCMTVWKAQDDHPLRAMVINEQGFLESYHKGPPPDTNRQSYADVYFYDQGPWTVRMSSLLRSEQTREGPGAWWWMGKNCIPVERLWVTGRDIHSSYDVRVAEWWLHEFRLQGRRNPGSVDEAD